jgi:predicted nucleotidyltransferase
MEHLIMSEFNYKKAGLFLKEKEKIRRKALLNKYRHARRDFNAIVRKIVTGYNPERIYQWGSLLNFKHFSEISDIDIAVEGIKSAEDFFKLYGELMELTVFPVDIVQIEKVEPEFADIIRKNGKIIYERVQ